jgi:hypothetical protein
MKFRNGFVSNSSTSSFIIVTTVENHEKTMQSLHPYTQAVVKHALSESGEFFGKKLVGYSSMRPMDGESSLSYLFEDFSYDGEIPKNKYGSEMDYHDALEEYCTAISVNKNEVFQSRIDM